MDPIIIATTEGGYGGDPFSDRSQRGLVDRSIEPGQFSRSNSGISKKDSTPAEHHGERCLCTCGERRLTIHTTDPLNPYGDSGPGTPNNGEWQSASDNSASRVADRRREQYESGEGLENDIGA